MDNSEIQKLIERAEKSIKCYIGTGDDPKAILKKIPTNIPVFDSAIGGGLIRGRIHLFSGEFASGKTYLAQKVIESSQKSGGICAYIDVEKRFDPDWFSKCGINIKELIHIRPNYGEQAIEAILLFIKEKIDVVVIDSIAALVPIEETEEGMEQKFIGLQARMLNKAFRKMIPINENTVIIGINQQRQEIGSVWHRGIQKKMPGGEGQYYYASLIVDIRKGAWLKDKDGNKYGHNINCIVTKCNFYPPFGECEIPLDYRTGQLDTVAGVINLAIDMGVITQKGAWYYLNGKSEPTQGKETLYEYFKSNQKEYNELLALVYKKEE